MLQSDINKFNMGLFIVFIALTAKLKNTKTEGRIMSVRLTGALPDWVSAKDVILEMLRRHGVDGGFCKAIEYYGAALNCLSAMDRHVIANMDTELGATSTVFPSDYVRAT